MATELQSDVSNSGSFPALTASAMILSRDQGRKTFCVYNDTSSSLYLKLGNGGSASLADFTVKILPSCYFEATLPCVWIGEVHMVASAASSGSAMVTSFS